MRSRRFSYGLVAISAIIISAAQAKAAVMLYGNENLLGTGTYPSDPTAGATLQGLSPNAVTIATTAFPHGYPFSPGAGDYPGTDQIYVGSVQTASHDGYSVSPQRINGPQIITLDYSSLVPSGQTISTFTLGIAADDFQQPVWGQPFTASINGVTDAVLTSTLNSLNQTGPVTQFFTIGLDPSTLVANDVLTLSINEGGDGGDGWAIDFLTVGVSTQSIVPEPSTFIAWSLLGIFGLGIGWWRKRRAA